jgi:hypothetical protein
LSVTATTGTGRRTEPRSRIQVDKPPP